ncbi:MAG: response regulator, partial [Bacilli bacterium]|nr:response regulator [Bacilli bacterium]
HEIRTPLNAIVGFSDCITEAKTLDEAKDNAKDIVNASTTLLEIVNGILDISKIEAGKLEIVNSNYDAKELFEELAKLIRPKMDEKALDFKYYIAPDLPPVLYGDHASIKKVVTNLLSNAYKYTDKGYVNYEVNCIRSKDACKLIISVEDTGRGIKKDSVDSLFTKFQRLEEDRNTTIEGTGLGLAITKQLVELMGGKIIVHTVYGEGSKFTIMLNQRIEKEEVIEEKPKVDSENLDLSGRKILLVDDNNLNLKVANKLLEKYGATDIDCVESGFECLDKINAGNKYDVILLDDMMPKMSGIETLEKLKEIEGFNIPVVALTANAITGMREKYLAKGFDDYLPKPIERKDLITVMNNVLGNEIVKEEPKEEKFLIQEVDSEVEGESKEDSSFDGEKYLRDNGVDMDNALELLGDMEMYNDTLDDYLSEIDSKLEELKKYKEENNMKEYSVLVHSMKSDAKYLGFMDFADIAYQHELKSKDNDSNFVNDNFEKLEEELTKVINIAKDYKKQA